MSTANNVTDALVLLLDGHSRFFHNVIVDITDKDALDRLNSPANHIAWIAGSLVYERYELLKAIGGSMDYTPNELFTGHKGLQEDASYPSLAQLAADWDRITPVLRSRLAGLEVADLQGPDPYEMPGGPYSLADSLLFCMDRESYCIGQIGLYRRLLGYPAMRYD